MFKKAISPLIATILLIGMSIVLGVLIFGFAQGWFSGLMEGTGEKSLTDAEMLNKVQMNVDIQVEGNSIKGTIANIGQVDFEKLNLNLLGTDGAETVTVESPLVKGDVLSLDETFNPSNIGAIKEIIVLPYVNLNGKISIVNVKTITKGIETSDKDLILYLPFSEGSGGVSEDKSGNGNDGILYGGYEWVEGKKGSALDFDSQGDYVKADWSDFTLSQHTIEFWMKVDNMPVYWHDIIGTYSHTDINRFHLHRSDNSIIWYNVMNGCGSLDSNVVPIEGEWYHVVGTYDGNTAKVYINGELKNSFGCPSRTINSQYCVIASNGGEYFDGVIDEVRIYTRPLSWSEIKMHYLEEVN